MLRASFHYFSLTRYKKIFIAGRKCYGFNKQVSVFLDVCRLRAAIPEMCVCVCVCVWEAIISICNRWELEEFKTTCKLSFIRFLEPLASSLYFLHKPNKTSHLNVCHREQKKKHLNTEIHLRYYFLIQIGLIIFLFCRFSSLFIYCSL